MNILQRFLRWLVGPTWTTVHRIEGIPFPVERHTGFPPVAVDVPCEIYFEHDELVLYSPARDNWNVRGELKAQTFTEAEREARKLGFEPQWN